MRTDLAHLRELSVIRKMQTTSGFEKAQSAGWAHLARERGNIQTICEEMAEVSPAVFAEICTPKYVIGEFADTNMSLVG